MKMGHAIANASCQNSHLRAAGGLVGDGGVMEAVVQRLVHLHQRQPLDLDAGQHLSMGNNLSSTQSPFQSLDHLHQRWQSDLECHQHSTWYREGTH